MCIYKIIVLERLEKQNPTEVNYMYSYTVLFYHVELTTIDIMVSYRIESTEPKEQVNPGPGLY